MINRILIRVLWSLSLAALLFSTAGIETGFLRAAQEASINPDINVRWRSENIEPLIDILESVNRDIYANRGQLAELVKPTKGSTVADVGAGSGFMVEEFAHQVGEEGMVYAVDINLKLLEQIEQRTNRQRLNNVRTILATDDSSRLPADSIDLIFICDTYHHLEYPTSMMRTIFEALKSGGEMVLVEFTRIPGESEDWILNHVRAGKEEFTTEILDAGLRLVEEHDAPFLPRNYVLRFRKP
jgi:ubiquinone/menaquinone biosynthesis C-methylase UbiE